MLLMTDLRKLKPSFDHLDFDACSNGKIIFGNLIYSANFLRSLDNHVAIQSGIAGL